MANVALRQVSKRFGQIEAVRDLSLAINDGEFVVLLGPSGAGKTTTLRLITGLERPDAGSISIDGRDVTRDPPGTRDIAFVFQQYSLYPHLYRLRQSRLSAALAGSPRSGSGHPQARRADGRALCTSPASSATGRRASPAAKCSGSRSAARLVRDPSIYLMDEPLSSLDAKLRAELRLELKRIQVELGATILYVTHDQVEAMTMASRIGVIKDGELLQLGTPREIYENPSDRYVASRLGTPQINFLPAGLIPEVAMPSGTDIDRHPHRAPADRGGQWRRHRRPGASHRAPRRPESCSSRIPGPNAGDACRSASAAAGRPGRRAASLSDPLYFDAAGRRIAATVH